MVGGARYSIQSFNKTAANLGTTMLTLSAIGLVVPAIFHYVVVGIGDSTPVPEQELSLEIAVILIVTYVLSLLFTLKTHKHLYAGGHGEDADEALGTEGWSTRKSLLVLLIATAFIALMSEFLVGAVQATAKTFGMTEVFVGVIVVAIIGNAAEHSTAVLMAIKNKMDIAINIAVGSSIQIALFVAPVHGVPELLHRPAADGPHLHQLRGARGHALGGHHGADLAGRRVELDGGRAAARGLRHPRHRVLLPAGRRIAARRTADTATGGSLRIGECSPGPSSRAPSSSISTSS